MRKPATMNETREYAFPKGEGITDCRRTMFAPNHL